MLYYTPYTEGLDAIARHYIRQQADDPTAHDRWQSELDCQALVLPYSTSWEKARREAVAVMGYTDRVQL